MAVEQNRIEAGDRVLKRLFGENYLFEIPPYQRPFSWGEDEFDTLIDDLLTAYDRNRDQRSSGASDNDNISAYEPYFLGSIILHTTDDQGDRYAVVDGQQRLTSLVILMAVIRDLATGDAANDMHSFIYEEGNSLSGTPARQRLKVREKEREFFETNVIDSDGTLETEANRRQISEPKQRILDAIELFHSRLDDWTDSPAELEAFAQFLVQRIVMVVIRAESFTSAYRLFNVTNARGLSLTNADLLKGENLSEIHDTNRRKQFADRWVAIEDEVGRETLEQFIKFIRHLKVKEKARKNIHEEFESVVFDREPAFKGEAFIERLESIHDIYTRRILDAQVDTSYGANDIYYKTLMCIVRNFYPSSDWMIALVKFDETFTDETALFEFFCKLERKIAIDWFSGRTFTKRLNQIYEIIGEIEAATYHQDVLAADILNEDLQNRRNKFKRTLDTDNFYRKGQYKMAKYLLLRLDMEERDNTDVAHYRQSVSIEHILPQTPTAHYWKSRFDDDGFRSIWTHRLGNLVPLNGRKNTSASNNSFRGKVDEYLKQRSDFELVNRLGREYDEWTPETLQDRHERLKQDAVDLWFESI